MLERRYAMGTGSSSVFQSTLLNVTMPASFLAVTWVRLEVKREGEGTNKAEGGGGEAWILGQGCLATGAPLKHPAAPLLHPRYLPPVFPSATCHVFLLHLLLLLSPRRVPSSPTATRHLPTLHLLPSVFSQRTHFAISNLQPLAERAPQTIDCIRVMVSPQVHRNDETQLDHQTSCTQPLLRQFLW